MADSIFAPEIIHGNVLGPTNWSWGYGAGAGSDGGGGGDAGGSDTPGGHGPGHPWGVPGMDILPGHPDRRRLPYEQIDSGVAVGGWVPFANYLNTQRSQHDTRGAASGPTPPPPHVGGGETRGPIDTRDKIPGGGEQPVRGNGLVEGPGLGGYYGQLAQEYLTGKRQ